MEAAIAWQPQTFEPIQSTSSGGWNPSTFEPLTGPTQEQERLSGKGSRFMQGIKDPANALGQLILHVAEAAFPNSELLKGSSGYLDRKLSSEESAYQDARKATGNDGMDWMRLGGGMLSTLPVMAAMPAAAGSGLLAQLGAGAASGAVGGALQPVTSGDSFGADKLMQTGLGAGIGAAAVPVSKMLGSILSPQTSPEVKMLMAEGVTPTPGQILGGSWKATEDKMTSVPILGDAIKYSQRKAIDEFNKAALNRTVAPIGENVGNKIGREGINAVDDALSQSYDRIVPNASFKVDKLFRDDMANVMGKVNALPQPEQDQFRNILRNQIIGKMSKSGSMSGDVLKGAESELSRMARGYGKDPSFDKQGLGAVIDDVVKSVRGNLERNSPADVANQLRATNKGFANYVRVADAASKLGSDAGVFTPAQLQSAVKAGDSSVRKTAFAKGNALMQDLSDAGVKVLGDKVPNSFTTDRLLMSLAAGGGLAGAGFANPAIPMAAGIGMLPYLPIGRDIAAAALTKRPEFISVMGNVLRNNPAILGAGGILAGRQ